MHRDGDTRRDRQTKRDRDWGIIETRGKQCPRQTERQAGRQTKTFKQNISIQCRKRESETIRKRSGNEMNSTAV